MHGAEKSLFFPAKYLRIAICKAFVLRVDAKSCISVSGSDALSTPIFKTSRSALHIAPLSMHGAKQERLCLTKCFHIAFPQAFFPLVETKSCVSDVGLGALPKPVYETMGTRRNPTFVNGWHLGVPSMRGITVALLFA